MKEIIEVRLKTRTVDFSKCKTDLLVVGHFSDAKGLDKVNAELNRKLDGAIERLIELGDFEGKEGTSAIVYGNANIGAKRVLLLGLGERKKATPDTIRKTAARAANRAVSMKAKNMSLALHRAVGGRLDPSKMGQACAEGTYFGSFRYDEFVTENENGRPEKLGVEVIESDPSKTKKLSKGVNNGVIIGRAQSYARTLMNRPANIINPVEIAKAAKKLAREHKNLSCTVYDEKKLVAKGMGGILAVGSGSVNKPRLIILEYTPAGRVSPKVPRVGFVGKAITFDSGGISIKPAPNMDQMKLDKTGGIAVLCTMKAVAELGLGVHVLGLIPSAENLPGGSSYRPGDIITTFSKKTVEVLNTDAEGRMVMCDALHYADKENCDIIIDIATLTGACKVALGCYMAGLMGNDEKLIKQLQRAAVDSGEKVWPMPSGDEYAKEMKSKIADLRNIGSKWGGACTAAAFLRQFVGERKWAHLDIAGVDIFEKGTETSAEGSSGFGVRLLTSFLMNLAAK
ncbi:MAG: leucyl aminopeptidase [Phycisphaerae bacterium]|nr:leucyl aminopeptidase [Phycisphaerae bacterium]NIP54340.1 leucyl aminopeptidase [Phycisphaerae bacterium]NIS53207.1 leucyl aminopeptidase [Phycisphaerae bacterium]NIU10693.1 leucyl aminopeptidase [Phycisphaerae bacterium]NIU58461.1 leucyl aminopeptidase [Phycisphaerae bacterium]